MRLLLDAGAVVDVRSDYHARTPLHYAAQDRSECMSILLERGSDVHARDHQRWTPLCFAARFDDASAIALLFIHAAEVDVRSSSGATPLAIAAAELADHGDDGVADASRIVDALRERGATPDRATTSVLLFRDDELAIGTTPATLVALLPLRRRSAMR